MTKDRKLDRGCVQVYTGDGKGKTTAALGQAFRAVGHNLNVFMILFMKGNEEYGELECARRLAPFIKIREMGRETPVCKENPEAIDIQWAKDGLQLASSVLAKGEVDLLILDEINVAIDYHLIAAQEVLELLNQKPDHMEVILTGRNAHADIVAMADLVSEMKSVKHYSDSGVEPRVGIER